MCGTDLRISPLLLVWRFYPNWKYLTYFRKVKVKLSKSSTFIRLSWQLAVKVRGCTYCYWDEKFRNQQWKCELWPHSRWTTWICLPTSCSCCQGDLGEVGLGLHLFWHAGDHHWNHILSLSSVVSPWSRILGPADQNIPPNWRKQSYSPD